MKWLPSKNKQLIRFGACATLAVCLLFGATSTPSVSHQSGGGFTFESRCHEINKRAITGCLNNCCSEQLRGLRRFFNQSVAISRQEPRSYAEWVAVPSGYSGVLGVNYARYPAVRSEAPFEPGMRAGGNVVRDISFGGQIVEAESSLTGFSRNAVSLRLLETSHFLTQGIRLYNQPPLVRPSERSLLFDSGALTSSAEEHVFSHNAVGTNVLSRARGDSGNREIDFDAPISNFVRSGGFALPYVALAFALASGLFLLARVASLVRSRAQLENAIEERTRQLEQSNRNLMAEATRRLRLEEEILNVVEEEREKLGRELHDVLGQQLTAGALLVESLARDVQVKSTPVAALASRIEEHLTQALSQTRMLAKGLYPATLGEGEQIDIERLLEQLAADARAIFKIKCRAIVSGSITLDGPNAVLHLYRIAQEGIRNAVRHGHASSVTITLTNTDGKPRMLIVDDGVGFRGGQAKFPSGIGLNIMRHRCNMLHLGFTISPREGGGTILCVSGDHK